MATKVLKYAYATEENWQEIAEAKVFAQMLRYVILNKGQTQALQVAGDTMNENALANLLDSELTPDNGYYIFGNKPAIFGELNTKTGRVSKAISFRTDTSGQEWAILLSSCEGEVLIPTTEINYGQSVVLGATEITVRGEQYYYVPAYPFDFSVAINSYDWDEITTTVPTWPQ